MLKNAYLLAKIGADTAENEQHFAESFAIGSNRDPRASTPAPRRRGRRPTPPSRRRARRRWPWPGLKIWGTTTDHGTFAKLEKLAKIILQIFGGLVLGCIKTKFCKKICVWEHFSSSARFAYFCTAAISKISPKSRFEKSAIFVNIQQKFYKRRKICKLLPIFKNFS